MESNKFFKKLGNALNSFLDHIDVFASPIIFKYLRSSSYKTIFGGTVSIIFLVITILLVGVLTFNVFSKTDQTQLIFDSYYDKNNQIIRSTMNYDYKTLNTSTPSNISEGMFFPFLTFRNRTSNLLLLKGDFDNLFTLEMLQIQQVLNSSDSSITMNQLSSIAFLPCQQVFNNSIFTIQYPDLSYCPNMQYFDVYGDFKTNISQYYQININFCNSSNVNCQVTETSINKIKQIEFIINYPEYKFDKTKKNDNIYISYYTKKVSLLYLSKISQKLEFYISADSFNSEENIFISALNLQKWTPLRVNNIDKKYSSLNNSIFTYTFNYDRNFRYSYRKYGTIPELLSQFCGFWTILSILGYLIIVKINSSFFWLALSNDLFNLIDVTNEKKIKNNNFKFMMDKKEGDKYPLYNKMIKLNNKTQIECEICLNYFAKERYKGIEYKLENFLTKIFCCQKNSNSVKNLKIIQLAKNETLKKMDLKKIYKFVFELSQLLNLIMGDKKELLLCGNSKAIYHSKINYFKEWFQKNKEIENLDKVHYSLYKEVNFLEGLRSLRFKPVIDEKIDVNLIKMFNIDPAIFSKYFINNRSLFEESEQIKKKVVKAEDTRKKKDNERKKIKLMKLVDLKENEASRSKSFDDRGVKNMMAIENFLNILD